MDTEGRFKASYLPDVETDCWLWQRLVSGAGYSRFFYDGRVGYGHRYAYEQACGAIPKGLTIDHLCRNRSCVNPLHLEAVTLRVNLLRGDTVVAVNARKTHCNRGHPLEILGKKRGCRICHAQHSRIFRERHPGYRQRYPN